MVCTYQLSVVYFNYKDMYCTCFSIRLIPKQQYIWNIKSETDFDELKQKISEIRLIKLNMEQWKLSICTCAGWHKYLKWKYTDVHCWKYNTIHIL